jgi:hypothetical protein
LYAGRDCREEEDGGVLGEAARTEAYLAAM